MPSAASARTPPTPSSSSCRMRTRWSPPYRRADSSRSSGRFAFDVRVEQQQRVAADGDLPHARGDRADARVDRDRHRFSVGRIRAGSHRQHRPVDVVVLLVLAAVGVEPLPEVALVVVEADANQRHAEIGRRLDVIAREDAEAARVDRQRLVQAELGGEVRDGPRPEDAARDARPTCASDARYSCMRRYVWLMRPCRPSSDGARLELVHGQPLAGWRSGCARRRATAAGRDPGRALVVSASQLHHRFDASSDRLRCAGARNWPSVRASLTTGASCVAGRHQQPHHVVAEDARLHRLQHEHALQQAAIDQRHAEKAVIRVFARLAEVLETRMARRVLDDLRLQCLGDEPREALRRAACGSGRRFPGAARSSRRAPASTDRARAGTRSRRRSRTAAAAAGRCSRASRRRFRCATRGG